MCNPDKSTPSIFQVGMVPRKQRSFLKEFFMSERPVLDMEFRKTVGFNWFFSEYVSNICWRKQKKPNCSNELSKSINWWNDKVKSINDFQEPRPCCHSSSSSYNACPLYVLGCSSFKPSSCLCDSLAQLKFLPDRREPSSPTSSH